MGGDDNVPDEVKKALDNFDKALDNIEKVVKPFVKNPVKDVIPKLEPLENAKLNVAISYSLNSLFYMYLKTQGSNPNNHPVKQDLERVKRYMEKIKNSSGKSSSEKSNEETNFILNS